MEYSKHELEFVKRMINHITSFRKGNMEFNDLVGQLEGELDAGEFKNQNFIRQWYDYWTPLEIFRAQKGNYTTLQEVKPYLSKMNSFLLNSVSE